MTFPPAMPATPITVCFLVLPDTLLLDLAGPAEAFRLANQQLARRGAAPAFELQFIGPLPTQRSSVGLQLSALAPLPEALPERAWVMLLGRPGEAADVVRLDPAWQATRRWLAQHLAPALAREASACRLMTVCSGALLAADAGLLAGRQVTTHHELLNELTALAPAAQVLANRIFVQDGPVWSSAGITAGIDLALHCIAQVLGEGLAAAVAEVMVVFHRRAADDPERSPLLAGRNHLHPAVHRVQNAVLQAPAQAWSMARLAELAHVTPRHLHRLFVQHVGCTPRAHVEQVRLSLLREALAAGLPRQQALALAGFASEQQGRRAVHRAAAQAS